MVQWTILELSLTQDFVRIFICLTLTTFEVTSLLQVVVRTGTYHRFLEGGGGQTHQKILTINQKKTHITLISNFKKILQIFKE